MLITLTGNVTGNSTEFGSFSVMNLSPESNYLWAHISVGFILFPLSILIMRRFSQNIQFTQMGLEINRTVLVENVPKSCCHGVEKIQRYIGVSVILIIVPSLWTLLICLATYYDYISNYCNRKLFLELK